MIFILLHIFYHNEKIDNKSMLVAGALRWKGEGDTGEWTVGGRAWEKAWSWDGVHSHYWEFRPLNPWASLGSFTQSTHSRLTVQTNAWCLCVCTTIFTVSLSTRMTFSPISVYYFRPRSSAIFSVKPVWNTYSQEKSFLVLNAGVVFLYHFYRVILQIYWCFSSFKPFSDPFCLCFLFFSNILILAIKQTVL